MTKEETSCISMRGVTKLSLAFDEKINWRYESHSIGLDVLGALTEQFAHRAELSAEWTADIIIKSTADGLEIYLEPSIVVPRFDSSPIIPDAPGHPIVSKALASFKEEFPSSVSFDEVAQFLKSHLQGNRANNIHMHSHELRYNYPMFNSTGDLILELGIRGVRPEHKLGRNDPRSPRGTVRLDAADDFVDVHGAGYRISECLNLRRNAVN